MIPTRPLLYSFACGFIAMACSCSDQDAIRQYTVEKRTADGPPAARDRDDVAAVPAAQRVAWFFKLTGPSEQTAQLAETVEQLVRSVKFNADGSPDWTLPAGWQSRRDQGLRFATLTAPTTPPLEMSIVPLPVPDPASAEFLKSNYDMWRSQLGLAAVEGSNWLASSLASKEVSQFETPAGKVTLVNITGKDAKLGEARTLAALVPGVPMSAQTPAAARPPVSPAGADSKPFTYTLPEGWVERPAGQFQTAVFAVDGENPTLVISVSSARGSLLDNINRWCGQIGREPFNEESLKAAAKPLTVSGKQGDYFVLEGAEQSILGVIVPEGGASWFFKAHGPKSLAERERTKFESFVQSIQFR